MNMNMNVFITGIDGSLGEAIADAFASDGHYATGTPRGFRTKEHMEAACAYACASAVNRSADIDVLVLNDGINHLSFIGQTPAEDSAILEVNVLAQYWALNWFFSGAVARPRKVIFIASQTHRVAQRTTALYCASKAAIVQLSRVAARELGTFGVQVNTLCPGKIEDTRMAIETDAQVSDLRGWDKDFMDAYAKSLVPLGRFTNTQEVAEGVMWLSKAPEYVHGAVIDMTGGV